MKTIFEHIEHIKGKPHHIRKQVAFGAASAGTAIIALVWLAGSLGTGAFALKATSFADSMGGEAALIVSGDSGSEQSLAGVAEAPTVWSASASARIQIIDATSSTMSGERAEQTIIPF